MERLQRSEFLFKCFLIFLCILIAYVYKAEAKKKLKPVVNYNSGVEVCKDPGSLAMIETSDIRAVRINETIAKMEGKFELKQTMDNWKMGIVMEKVTPLGSKEVMLTHEIKNLCTEIARKNEDTLYAPYLRTITFPNCPVPPDTYEIINMIADTSQIPINSGMEGEYIFTFTFYEPHGEKTGMLPVKKSKKIGCLSFSCVIEPAS